MGKYSAFPPRQNFMIYRRAVTRNASKNRFARYARVLNAYIVHKSIVRRNFGTDAKYTSGIARGEQRR